MATPRIKSPGPGDISIVLRERGLVVVKDPLSTRKTTLLNLYGTTLFQEILPQGELLPEKDPSEE